MQQLSGSEIIIQFLKDEGVEFIFGYPGGAVLHIYDALYAQNDIQHILVRHEQGASHMADGYARACGKPGVVLVTSGPGATNVVTGIATAHMDSIPMVVLTGQVPTDAIGSDAFQEVDCIGITRPCVKHNFLVKDVNDLAMTLKKAFYVATSGRPGPVVVDIPKDVTRPDVKIAYEYPTSINMRSYNPVTRGHTGQMKKALDLLMSAQRPMLYTGGGVILDEGSEELTKFTRTLGLPITNTLMGLGAYPATDKQFVGMLGMHGTYEANMAMHECDVLVAIGARFDDRVVGDVKKFCPNAQIVHIDIDPSSIAKTVKVHVPIVGPVRSVLQAMNAMLAEDPRRLDAQALQQWWAQIEKWRAINCLDYGESTGKIKPQYVVQKLYEVTGGDAYITSDVGQHQMWAAQYYPFDKPRRWINSGGLGTMGFGLPAALGVQFAFPDMPVACVTGEGSIVMCIQELSTAKQYGLPVKVINLNNGYLGMVRQWQEFVYENRESHTYLNSLPDFAKLTESFGHVGMRIEKQSDVEGALKEAFAMKDRLVFMDFVTDPTENVYPMMLTGKGHHEMVLSEFSKSRELA
ncbi:MAG: acetolactate synthase-1/2/3 large subunit [Gammaproteobacteria bacterium]|jgi:acetolactate synthase-1/2/3 large subunit